MPIPGSAAERDGDEVDYQPDRQLVRSCCAWVLIYHLIPLARHLDVRGAMVVEILISFLQKIIE